MQVKAGSRIYNEHEQGHGSLIIEPCIELPKTATTTKIIENIYDIVLKDH